MKTVCRLAALVSLAGCMSVAEPEPGALLFTELAAGTSHTCGLTADGTTYCWGDNADFRLGSVPGGEYHVVPQQVLTQPYHLTSLDAGLTMSCGMTGAADELCWGGGQRGLTRASGTPPFTTVAAGDFGCGLSTSGKAYCWPSTGALAAAVSPELTFAAISVGGQACAVTADGEPYCWGPGSVTAQPVGGSFAFRAVSVGGAHACGLTADGIVACWGDDSHYQLGAAGGSSPTPVQVFGTRTYTAVSAGLWHTCALASDATAFCWGDATYDQLGVGFHVPTGVLVGPSMVAGGITWRGVTAGGRHSCGVSTAGEGFCWGDNTEGQLGDGTTVGAVAPVLVDGER